MALITAEPTVQSGAFPCGAAHAPVDDQMLYIIASCASAFKYGCTEEQNRALRSLFVTTITGTAPPAGLHVHHQHEHNTHWTYSDRTGWLYACGVRSQELLQQHLDACAESALDAFQCEHHTVLPRDALYFMIIRGGVGIRPNL